jgi:hypothetical protein
MKLELDTSKLGALLKSFHYRASPMTRLVSALGLIVGAAFFSLMLTRILVGAFGISMDIECGSRPGCLNAPPIVFTLVWIATSILSLVTVYGDL